jgi:hypothetical protein
MTLGLKICKKLVQSLVWFGGAECVFTRAWTYINDKIWKFK